MSDHIENINQEQNKELQNVNNAITDNSSAETSVKEQKNKTIENFGHKPNEDIWGSFLTEKMFAHRGLHNSEFPENSLSAFENAIKHGYAIELDVHPIADGTPVVFHDSKMSRMTKKDKYIETLTKEELSTTYLLNSNQTIPTLEEVLNLVDGRTPILVEIKHQQKVGDLEKRVLELLKNYNGEYAVQSFDPFVLKWFYENAPQIWRGQLSSYFKGEKMNFVKKSVLKRLAFSKITHHDFVSYDINNLPNRFVKKLECPLLTWTVNSQKNYLKAIQIADNVIFECFEPKI